MRESLRGLLIMGAAVAVSLGATSLDAEAASITPTHVKVDYNAQQLQISQAAGTKDTKFYMATSTVSINKNNLVTLKTAAATEYDSTTAGNVVIDLSSFAITKDNYVSIWGNKNTDPILIKLPAATAKIKAVVDPVESQVTIQNTADSKNPVPISSDIIEYCTGNGSWKNYYDTAKKAVVDLTGYAKLGATLRFRVKATATAQPLLASAASVGNDKDGNAVSYYQTAVSTTTSTFASNEVKVKIAKTAAGPKATIDFDKRTIKIPATSEYRLTLGNATALTSTFTVPTPDQLANGKPATVATLKADDILKTVTAAIGTAEFDLRTAKTDKKPASKITEYKLPAIGTTLAVASNGKAPAAATTVDNAVVGSAISAAGYKDAYVKFNSVVYNAKTGVVTGIKLENVLTGSTDKYQVVISDDTAIPSVDAKAVILNPGKTDLPKVTQISAKEGQNVFIRKMGDKKGMVWSTPYVLLGKVPAAPSEATK